MEHLKALSHTKKPMQYLISFNHIKYEPTKLLNKPKYFAPLKPRLDLSNTTNGKPNFCEGLPIKFENK